MNRKEGVKIQSTVFCDQHCALPQVTIKRHFATFSKPINSVVTTRRPRPSSSKSTNGSSINVPLLLPNEETITHAINKDDQTLPEAKNYRKKSSTRTVARKELEKPSKTSATNLQASTKRLAENKISKPTAQAPQKENVEFAGQGTFILDTIGHQLAFIENSSSKLNRENHHKVKPTKKFGPPSDKSQKLENTKVSKKDLTNDRTNKHFQECDRLSKPYNPNDYTEREPSIQSNPLHSVIGLSEGMFQSTSALNLLLSQASNHELANNNFQNPAVDKDKWNHCLMTLENLPNQARSKVDPEKEKHFGKP